jgi:DNA-binding MarR family transcriptional regulator
MALAPGGSWTLLSNHGKVLFCIAQDPRMRVVDIAACAGIKERAVQRILADLRAGGYVSSTRDGRRNVYAVNRGAELHWSPNGRLSVGDLVDTLRR